MNLSNLLFCIYFCATTSETSHTNTQNGQI